ncbi:hypothetical protein [Phytohabitans aurantiacus]|uniref:C-type lysozyme inhibitor domain-containing protein n=1 Tax=Phytohabitans aurantiacus TaxID=3016789 RepID=A0ABQ5R6T8_9ACTN|nr:hypothetical protein [Phytohabitans aurantiacus]GLI02276.1 hypothetical protein Pa4123_75540 [Phytohabitans aurantiacus]
MDAEGEAAGATVCTATSVAVARIWAAVALVLGAAACGPHETDTAPTQSVVLVFDTKTCRNSGTVQALGVVWELVDAVPIAWRKTGEQAGSLSAVEGRNATFTAGDGTVLRVTNGPHEQECVGWDDPGG